MGLYMYVNQQDIDNMKKVEDKDVNREFQAALKIEPRLLMIQKTFWKNMGWFKKSEPIQYFDMYYEVPAANGMPYQARMQFSGSGTKDVVIAYLHGLINGAQLKQDSDDLEPQSNGAHRVRGSILHDP